MSNETTAQRISSLLNDDGQCWTDALGRHLNEIAEAEGGRRTSGTGRVRAPTAGSSPMAA
jgi:hypothetical protein